MSIARTIADVKARLGHRADSLAAAAVLFALLVIAGGLHWAEGTAALAAYAGWAALWPTRDNDAGTLSPAQRQRDDRAAGAGGARSLTEALLEGLGDAVLLLDSAGTAVGASVSARAIFPGLLGHHVTAAVRIPELLTAIDTARASGLPQNCSARMGVPVERHFACAVIPFQPNAQARASGSMFVVLRDLTEQDQLTRMRADFVANASHELRTPLASLMGFIETLQGAAKDDAAARERFLDIMQQQATRMARLIDDLLSLSRVEMRQHLPPRDQVDLGEAAREAVRLVTPVAESAGIALRTDLPPAGAVVVTGDRDEILQVLQNLVQNAIKYNRRGGWVSLSLDSAGGRAAVTVSDNGIGIAPQHLPRLTERFYRVNAKDSRERGGTGLGLAIVKHIVNRHQGELRITSTPGEGSQFTMFLPLTPAAARIASPGAK
ncbi:MAG: ATP-binding protein [Hyphomicrobiaceae bacterium]